MTESQHPRSGDGRIVSEPLEISPRLAAVGLAVALALAAALVAKQIAFAKVTTRDATGYYLPLARAFAAGDYEKAFSPIIPPLYPVAIGLVGRVGSASPEGLELAGSLVSAVSAMCLIVLVFFIGRRLGNRRVGLAAAVLAATNIWIIRHASSVAPVMMYAAIVATVVLLLIEYYRKASLPLALLIGAASGIGALVRSEGAALPFLAAIIMLSLHLRRSWRERLRAVIRAGALLAVAAAVWLPRISYVHSVSGYHLLDVRLIRAAAADWRHLDPQLWKLPDQVLTEADIKAFRETPRFVREPRGWIERFKEAQESLLGVVGYPTVLLAAVWFLWRRNLPRKTPLQIILAIFFILQIAIAAPLALSRRYVAAVAGLVQVWGGLGAVVLAERFKPASGWMGDFGRSIPRQLAALALLAVAMASISLFGTNQGIRHQELKILGQLAQREYGAGRTFLAPSAEVPYYASGKYVKVQSVIYEKDELSEQRLFDFCEEASVDFIVVRSRDKWWGGLLERIEADRLPKGAMVAQKTYGEITSYLIDANRLFAGALPTRQPG